MSLGDKTQRTIKEVKEILENHGRKGWLPVKECEERYIKLDAGEKEETRRRRFYRMIKDIDKGKINDLQHIVLGKKAWIGLREANPKDLKVKPSMLQMYLIKRFWEDLKQVEHENLYGNPERAFNMALFLIYKLPNPHKQQLMKLKEQLIEKIKGAPTKSILLSERIKAREWLLNFYYTKAVPTLIARIAEHLYEMEEGIFEE
ncbi:MAG: hypothetical protein QXO67_05100 [Candidatus Bathyarchaeia archaeon]